MKISSLERKNNSIIFTGERMHIYIPKNYFDKKLASYNGKFVYSMGIFLFEITTDEKFNKNIDGVFHTLKLPVKINFEYSSTFSCKKKIKNFDEDSYNVFILEKNNIFMDNIYKEQNPQVCKEFMDALHGGNIPKIVPYNEIIELYLDNINITKMDLRNPSVIFEIIISEVCRYKNNMKIPFRKIIGKDNNISEYEYKNINIKSVPNLNSTFSDLAFEDLKQALISSIKKTKTGEKELESPVEKTIKY